MRWTLPYFHVETIWKNLTSNFYYHLLSKPKKVNQTIGLEATQLETEVKSILTQCRKRRDDAAQDQHSTASRVPGLSLTDLAQLPSFSVTQLSLFGQGGFNIQNIGNIGIYIKVQQEPPNVRRFRVVSLDYPASNGERTSYTPHRKCRHPCVSFNPLGTQPQEFRDSSAVLKALTQFPKQWITIALISEKSLYIN